ncbi:hypothetical protein BKA70DRAFT_1571667 [Coprinopsis sp. MPI-PUGE-AT-0042]|nr:hypothetical protein BKA70DRAFT_1571667 [Coprinopsis sp. MPI-PUGE-AT-0042]
MVASQASDILRLPAEPLLAIFYLLSPNSEDIVALRQTCKALYEIEKKHHTTIWKLCIDSLSEEAALFLPTFSWRSPSSKIQEQLVRRASCFKKALYQYRDMSLADNAPRDTVELKLPTDFSDLALLPGGRFLLGISSGTIGVFDLLPYYESGGTPAEIGSFPCAHMCEQFLARHAVTFAGENADRIRVMLAFPDDPDGCSPRDNYDLEEDGEGYVFLIEVHEISFADEELAHKLYGPLPLGRDESDTVDHDLYTMSADCVGAILDTRNAVVWNYVNETYHMFTLENHETETPADKIVLSFSL